MRFTAESVCFFFWFSLFSAHFPASGGDATATMATNIVHTLMDFISLENIQISSDSYVTACALFITFILHKWKLLSRIARARPSRVLSWMRGMRREKSIWRRKKCEEEEKKLVVGGTWSVLNESGWDGWPVARRPIHHKPNRQTSAMMTITININIIITVKIE